MRLQLTILIFSLFSFQSSFGQWKCGTTHNQRARQAQEKFMPGYFGCEVINKTDRTLPITVHIAEDSLGGTGYFFGDLDEAIDKLNIDFEPIGLSFEVCDIRIMENFQFNFFDREDEEDYMLSMYYQVNTINIYLTNVVIANGQEVGGYAKFPGAEDVMVIAKQNMNGDLDVLVHEMGHFFGLYHTFQTVDTGVELVDGSNCETAGDLICDTEADANSTGSNLDFPDCNYNGLPVTDANGDFYVPPTNNYMSYYSDECTCRFTPQQYNRMLEQFQLFRTNLW